MQRQPIRGEVYFVSLEPTFGAEIGGFKMRPVVVVSLTSLLNATNVAIVVPGTSEKTPGKQFPNDVLVHPDGMNNLPERTIFKCHQVRAVSVGRIVAPPKGRLSAKDMARIEKALRYCMGLDIEPLGPPPAMATPKSPKA